VKEKLTAEMQPLAKPLENLVSSTYELYLSAKKDLELTEKMLNLGSPSVIIIQYCTMIVSAMTSVLQHPLPLPTDVAPPNPNPFHTLGHLTVAGVLSYWQMRCNIVGHVEYNEELEEEIYVKEFLQPLTFKSYR
jgi:hypothetical protein